MKTFMFPLSFKLGCAGSTGPHLNTRPHTYSRPLGQINSYFFFRDKICRGHEHSGVFPGKTAAKTMVVDRKEQKEKPSNILRSQKTENSKYKN